MAVDKIQICNMALNMLKSGGSILDIDNPTTTEERVFSAWYDIVKNEVLRIAHYKDSIRRRTISADPVAPEDFSYSKKWKLPSDCVKLIALGDCTQIDEFGYVVEGGYVCLKEGYKVEPSVIIGNPDAYDINIRYIYNIDESDMSLDFAKLQAYALAAEPGVAMVLTDNTQVISNANAFYAGQLRKFQSANMQENRPVVIRSNGSRVGKYSRFTKVVY